MCADTANRGNAIKDTLEIYDYYSGNYSYRKIVEKDKVVKSIDVLFGVNDKYEIIFKLPKFKEIVLNDIDFISKRLSNEIDFFEKLPENTSLQRKIKQLMLQGKHLGSAYGELK